MTVIACKQTGCEFIGVADEIQQGNTGTIQYLVPWHFTSDLEEETNIPCNGSQAPGVLA